MRLSSAVWIVVALVPGACGDGNSDGPTPTQSTPPPDFQLTCGTSTLPVGRGCASSTCAVTATNGFSGTVELRYSGLPSGIRVDAGNPSIAVSANGTTEVGLTVSVAPDVDAGTYALKVSGASGPLTRSFDMEIVWNGATLPAVEPGRGPMTLTGCAGYREGVLGSGTLQRFRSAYVGAWAKTWRGEFCAQVPSADDGYFTFLVPRGCFRQGQSVYLTAGGLDTCVTVPYGSGQHAHLVLLGQENGFCE